MNRIALFGATAAALVAVGVGGLLLSSGSNPGVGGEPTQSPSTSSSPGPSDSGVLRAIPVGTYATPPMSVADIRAQLDADQALTAGEKDSIINDILDIDGRGTLATYMVVGDNSIDGRVSRDGGPPERDTTFPVTWVDADQFRWTNARGEQTWGIRWDGDSYHLVARTPAGGNVELFVRRILFESQPFSPVP